MEEKRTFRVYKRPKLQSASLVVGWSEDAGHLGARVVDYLNRKLGCEEFGEMEPVGFFPLGGVAVRDDVAEFPAGKFHCCRKKNLVTFISNPPRADWYKFLNSILDVVSDYCQVEDVYTVGGMVSFSAHTAPRPLMAVANSEEVKEALARYDLSRNMDYETPPGQRPTLSSYLLWVAKQREMKAASLWVPVPFYLVSHEDPRATRSAAYFLDQKLKLGIDFADLDGEVVRQNAMIANLASRFSELEGFIRKLETNIALNEQETERLAEIIGQYLGKEDVSH